MKKKNYEEYIKFTLGDLIGEGVYRKVYECAFDPNFVIKEQMCPGEFSNITEWLVWDHLSTPGSFYKEIRKWLAPCYNISENGKYLLQARVKPLKEKQIPKKVPVQFQDVKLENMGWYKGRVVFCDYEFLSGFIDEKISKKLKFKNTYLNNNDSTN